MQFGNRLELKYKGTTLTGRYVSTSGKSIIVKLDNGYNVSIPIEEAEILKETPEESETGHEVVETFGSGDKRVMMLHTGGTIASRVDYSTGAVTPVRDLRFLAPGLRNIQKEVTVDSMVIDNVLSENMQPDHWLKIAESVAGHIDDYDGIVVTHGTDTMSYTGSALAFMFEKLKVPVILTGSQRSSDRPSSDAFQNIEAAVRAAVEDVGEVCISFHAGTSDDRVNIIRAVRSRKMHSSRRDAIRPMGSGLIGVVDNRKVRIADDTRRRATETVLKKKIRKDVLLYYFSPLSDPEDFRQLAQGKGAAVIMGTGLGHIGERFFKPIRDLTDSGTEVMITSQTIYGEVNLDVYSTGRRLQEAGAFAPGRILPEVVATKAMWVLANHRKDDFRTVMKQDLRGENPGRETYEEP